jgi:phosphatidylglycerol lysyltransferase
MDVTQSQDQFEYEPPKSDGDGSPLPFWLACWRRFNAVNSAIFTFIRHPLITAVGSLVIFLIALRVINQELTKYSLIDLQRAIDDIGILTLLGAGIAAVGSYSALVFHDRFTLAALGKRLPLARTARASLAAYALANTLGYSWATAATARQRLYRKWGLLPSEIGTFSFVSGNGVQIGGLAVAGLGLLLAAREVADHGPLNWIFWFCVGLIILLPAGAWLAYARLGPANTDIAGAPLYRPTPSAALAHLSAVILDWVGAAAILFILLPNHGGWSFPAFLSVFVLAGMLGAVSGAPGGLGVFEAAILTLAPIGQDTPGAAIALLIYRLIYNIVPLGVATLILGLDHAAPAARPAAHAARRVSEQIGSSTQEYGPRIGAILVFITGFSMLAAIATPPITARLIELSNLKLGAISETSHIMAGIIGTILLMVSATLWRRVKEAWIIAVLLLALAAIVSLLKGLSYEEAGVILCVLLFLLATRDGFVSRSSRATIALSPGWLSMIFGSLATISWIASFSYPDLFTHLSAWQDYAIENDVGRTQRALFGVFLGALLIMILHLSARNSVALSLGGDEEDDDDEA